MTLILGILAVFWTWETHNTANIPKTLVSGQGGLVFMKLDFFNAYDLEYKILLEKCRLFRF